MKKFNILYVSLWTVQTEITEKKYFSKNTEYKIPLYMNTSVLKQDTGFNVGPNDVSSDIKVDPDEFPLSRLTQDKFQEVHKTT